MRHGGLGDTQAPAAASTPLGCQHPVRIHRCPPWQTIGSRGSGSSDAASELLLPAPLVHVGRAAMAAEGVVLRKGCQRLECTARLCSPRTARKRVQYCRRRHAQRRHLQRTLCSVPRASQLQHCVRKGLSFLTVLHLQDLECLCWPASAAQQGVAEQL